jgi:hypothetical protein
MKVPTEIPTTIFIDTQIFDSIQYNFKGGSAKGFLSAISDHDIILLLPDPTRREIERHIRELSSRAIQSLKLAQKTNSCLRMLDGWPLTDSKPDSLKAALAAKIQADLSKFLKEFTVEGLDYSGVSLSEVMNWRDELAPPFSESKISEYPDAFTLSILRHYSKSKNENVAVISGDRDFKRACETNDALIYTSPH